MRKVQEGSLYIAIALYFLRYCSSWENPSSALSGLLRQSKMPGRPNSRGRLSLNLYTGPPTKHQKWKNGRGWPPPEKKKEGGEYDTRESGVGIYGVCNIY